MGKWFLDFSFWTQGYRTAQCTHCALLGHIIIRGENAGWNGERCRWGSQPFPQPQVWLEDFHVLKCDFKVNDDVFFNDGDFYVNGDDFLIEWCLNCFLLQPHWHLLCFLGSGGWWEDSWRTRTPRTESIYQWGKRVIVMMVVMCIMFL